LDEKGKSRRQNPLVEKGEISYTVSRWTMTIGGKLYGVQDG
jgi:hypothetical protein